MTTNNEDNEDNDANKPTCSICVEPFNYYRRKIVCQHCNLISCTACATQYNEKSAMTPQCMQCHHVWSHEYIRSNFGYGFIKKMGIIRKKILFNEQQALFPFTQEYVSLCARMDDLRREEYVNSRNRSISHRDRREVLERINDERYDIRLRLVRFRNALNNRNTPALDSSVTEVFIKPCGLAECKGYINASSHTCGLCNTVFCSKCLEVLTDDHRCSKENIATVTMLRKDTKGCPSCAVPIHRISGCPDMFCVSCKTAFNWNTLEINRRGNSNPHYYQWVRESTNQYSNHVPDEGYQCRNYTSLRHTYRCENWRNMTKEQQAHISNIVNTFHHYQRSANVYNYYKLYSLTKALQCTFEGVTLQSRVNYMNNKLSKDKFTQFLLKVNKAMEFNDNMDQIVDSVRLFRESLMHSINFSQEFNYDETVSMALNFANYINECVSHLQETFYTKSSKEFITKDLSVIPKIP